MLSAGATRAREQLDERERLREIVVAPVRARHAILDRSARREHEDGRQLARSDRAQDRTVDARGGVGDIRS
jgi:hypothetical protein